MTRFNFSHSFLSFFLLFSGQITKWLETKVRSEIDTRDARPRIRSGNARFSAGNASGPACVYSRTADTERVFSFFFLLLLSKR